MKKALQITLAGSLFTIEEDAFDRLSQYLNSIKSYFGKTPDNQDVVDDIEARIAEQLLEAIKSHNNIVTLEDVNAVITSMGTVEEITGDEAGEQSESKEEASAPRKLYRDPDDAIVAGVASGLAAYFGIDPLLMRGIFVVLAIFTTGAFIFAYIALAIFVPKAITQADKIKMRGGPMTLNSFKETMREHVDDFTKNSKKMGEEGSPLRRFIEKIFEIFGIVVRGIWKIFVKLMGLFLTVVPIMMILLFIFVVINMIFNASSGYINFPIEQVIPGGLYYIAVILGFIILFIPALFVAAIGVSMLSAKRKMGLTAVITLLSIWIVSLFTAGTLALKYAPQISNNIENLPQQQTVSKVIDVKDFTKLDLYDSTRVKVIQGDEYSVTAQGVQARLDRLQFGVKDSVLKINEKNDDWCLGCGREQDPDITITVPSLAEIAAHDISRITVDSFKGDAVKIILQDASRLEGMLEVKDLVIKQEDVSRSMLTGTAANLALEMNDASRFEGMELMVNKAVVITNDVARAEVHATGALEATARDSSKIMYDGVEEPVIKTQDIGKVEHI
ncbi:MAG TPA: DUF2807 domain-containing protein [Candidatus Paceibacterota bacterium]